MVFVGEYYSNKISMRHACQFFLIYPCCQLIGDFVHWGKQPLPNQTPIYNRCLLKETRSSRIYSANVMQKCQALQAVSYFG